MSKNETKAVIVKDGNSKENSEILLWEELIPLAENTLEMLSMYEKVLNEVFKAFNVDKIENNELKKSLETLSNIRDTIKNDIVKLMALHSKVEEIDGKKTIIFRKGELDPDNNEEATLFVTTSLAYSNINTQLTDLIKVVTKNLLMDIAEVIDKDVKEEIDVIIKESERKEEDGK